MNIDERIAAEIDAIVDECDKGNAFWSHVRPLDAGDAGWSGMIPIVGTIDSYTGDIAWLDLPPLDPSATYTDGPLPEPPAPPAQYAAGRMPLGAWLVGALSIAAAVAIAAAVVLVERVKGRK